jgi:hypothetical protein
MPGRTGTQHEDRHYPENRFPFSHAMTTDPFSRTTGALLQGRPTGAVFGLAGGWVLAQLLKRLPLEASLAPVLVLTGGLERCGPHHRN